jgi:hypothetical protein
VNNDDYNDDDGGRGDDHDDKILYLFMCLPNIP